MGSKQLWDVVISSHPSVVRAATHPNKVRRYFSPASSRIARSVARPLSPVSRLCAMNPRMAIDCIALGRMPAQTRRVERRQASGREWPEVDATCHTVEDQFTHRLAGRGRVEHAPDTVAGGHIGAVTA